MLDVEISLKAFDYRRLYWNLAFLLETTQEKLIHSKGGKSFMNALRHVLSSDYLCCLCCSGRSAVAGLFLVLIADAQCLLLDIYKFSGH